VPRPWTADFEISPALAENLIAEQYPQLRPVQAEILGIGWDNVAMLVNGQYVFRFPRRALGAKLLETEIRVMPTIARMLPICVPDHRFVGHATDEFQWPFAGYPFISGRTACSAQLSEQQRGALAAPLARFLKALHQIPREFAFHCGAQIDSLGRFDMPRRKRQSQERLAYVAAHQLVDDICPFMSIVESAPTDYTPRADTLLHGDLYARHLLLNETGQLSGVIDWGDIHVGDPAHDLAIALTFLPPGARADFFAIYGPVGQITLTMAKFRAVNHTACVLHYAHQIGDENLLSEMRLAMQYIVG
jgi:aminoglycoside phosphotransferase (APT) family kinase protein